MKNYLEAGTKILLSQVGHNGFFYPDDNRPESIMSDSFTTYLPWASHQGLIPVLIEEKSIYFNANPHRKIVVWVQKESIKTNKR